MAPDELSENAAALISTVRELVDFMGERDRLPVFGKDDLGDVLPAEVVLTNLLYDLQDLTVTLIMLLRTLREIRELDKVISPVMKTHQGMVSAPAVLEAMSLGRQKALEAEVLLKAAYNGLYGVQELLEDESLRSALSKDLRERLEVVVQVRHGLITHKRENRVHLRGTRMAHKRDLVLRFGAPMPAGDETERATRARQLWERADKARPGLLPDEQNVYIRVQWLYENQTNFEGPLRAEIKAYVKQFGVESHTPLVLARLVLDLAKALVPAPSV